MPSILALDPGFGNTKICLNGHVAVMQSAIARPQSVGMAAIRMRTTSQVKLIRLDEHEFAIGPGPGTGVACSPAGTIQRSRPRSAAPWRSEL